MSLFSEKELLDSTGLSTGMNALTDAELGRKILHKKYDRSIVTVVTFDQDDWVNKRGSLSLKKLFFTPKDKYETRRAELADMFPMAVVVQPDKVPYDLNKRTLRNCTILIRDNYAVLPIRQKKRRDSMFVGCQPFNGHARELFMFAEVVDLFIGGRIITDKLNDILNVIQQSGSLSLRVLCRLGMFNSLVARQGARFDAKISSVEEVLA